MPWRQLEFDFNPPTNDKERFLRYQQQYKAGDRTQLDSMYKLIKKMAFRTIRKQITNKGVYMCVEDMNIKAYNVASYIIEQYIKRPDFEIKEILGYIFPRVRHELYYRTKLDDTLKAIQQLAPESYFQNMDEIQEELQE